MLKSTKISLNLQNELNSAIRHNTRASQEDTDRKLKFEKDKLDRELEVKDRINISRKEYEETKSKIEHLKLFKYFVEKLSRSIKVSPEMLLKSKSIEVFNRTSEINPFLFELIVKFKYDKEDLEVM